MVRASSLPLKLSSMLTPGLITEHWIKSSYSQKLEGKICMSLGSKLSISLDLMFCGVDVFHGPWREDVLGLSSFTQPPVMVSGHLVNPGGFTGCLELCGQHADGRVTVSAFRRPGAQWRPQSTQPVWRLSGMCACETPPRNPKPNEGDLIGNGGSEKKSVSSENMCFFLMKTT